eukprot:1438001-Prymnesium_polylepis.1
MSSPRLSLCSVPFAPFRIEFVRRTQLLSSENSILPDWSVSICVITSSAVSGGKPFFFTTLRTSSSEMDGPWNSG